MLRLNVDGLSLFVLSGYVEEREEGDFVIPYFRVTVENPGVASGVFLDASRYATLTETVGETTVTIAHGRMLGLPADMGGETVELEFVCVPEDEDEVLRAAADALRTPEWPNGAPYDPEEPDEDAEAYDPLFYSPEDDDPASPLLGRPEIWRWDRVTNSLSRTHMTEGDAHLDLGAGLHGSLSVQMLNPPRKKMKLRLMADWLQRAEGVQTSPTIWGEAGEIETFTPDDFISSMPQPGTPVGDDTGWHVAEAQVLNVFPDIYTHDYDVPAESHLAGDEEASAKVLLRKSFVHFSLRLGYRYEQPRQEILDIVMSGDLQNVLGDDRTEAVDTIQLGALDIDPSTPPWQYEDPDTLEPMEYEVDDYVIANGKRWKCLVAHEAKEQFLWKDWVPHPIFAGLGEYVAFWELQPKAAPLPAISHRFFDTTRGVRAIRHGIRRLKRVLLQRTRCLQVTFQVDWETGKSLTCAHTASVTNERILGGTVTGKVSAVRLVLDGPDKRVEVTLLVPVGTGEEVDFDDYGHTLTAPPAKQPVVAAGLANRGPRQIVYHNLADEQADAAEEAVDVGGDPLEAIGSMPTRVQIVVWPLQQEDLLVRRMSVDCGSVDLPGGISL